MFTFREVFGVVFSSVRSGSCGFARLPDSTRPRHCRRRAECWRLGRNCRVGERRGAQPAGMRHSPSWLCRVPRACGDRRKPDPIVHKDLGRPRVLPDPAANRLRADRYGLDHHGGDRRRLCEPQRRSRPRGLPQSVHHRRFRDPDPGQPDRRPDHDGPRQCRLGPGGDARPGDDLGDLPGLQNHLRGSQLRLVRRPWCCRRHGSEPCECCLQLVRRP